MPEVSATEAKMQAKNVPAADCQNPLLLAGSWPAAENMGQPDL